MTTIIFVHGTGGRQDSYAGTFRNIEQKLHQLKPEVKLVPCLWGEVHGTKLNAGGLSIPNYDSTRVNAKSQEDEEILLWKNLYKDPLYEINLLSFRQPRGQANIPGRMTPSQEISKRIQGLTTSSQLEPQLQKAGISSVFEDASKAITTSKPFSRLLDTASRPLDADYAAIARAIVAASIEICDTPIDDNNNSCYPPIHHNKKLRDETVDSITRELTQDTQSRGVIGDFVKNSYIAIGKFAFNKYYVQRKRGAITDASYPFSGDILFYQAKGEKIREFIQEQIKNVEPPVVLLAHSLGGIACVDLLIEQELPQVKLLITVGSQAPFLYEINSLQSLSYGDTLPEYFPKWLNIYDLRDILSYVGEGLFPNKIEDVHVDNKQPFPEAHGAYWDTEATWDKILEYLERMF